MTPGVNVTKKIRFCETSATNMATLQRNSDSKHTPFQTMLRYLCIVSIRIVVEEFEFAADSAIVEDFVEQSFI